MLVESVELLRHTKVYHRIRDRRKKLIEIGKKAYNELGVEGYMNNPELISNDDELDCIDNFFEAERYSIYETICDYAEGIGVERVIDIGCAFGHQSEVFFQSKIDYMGIDNTLNEFWNKDKYNYQVGTYPFDIETKSNDLAISVLCLTWQCYLLNGIDTLKEQCEALSKDFEHAIIYTSPNNLAFLSSYFKNVIKLDGHLYYFSNK